MNSNAEGIDATQTHATAVPRARKKPNAAKPARHDAPSKAKPRKKASGPKKGPHTAKKGHGPGDGSKTDEAKRVRQGSKTETILDLLKRAGGVTAKELLKATGWQAHSLRGFLSGTISKKMGLAVTSSKGEDGERTYAVKS